VNKAVIVTVGFQIVFWQYPAKEGTQKTLCFRYGIHLKNCFVHLKDTLNGETDCSIELTHRTCQKSVCH
jgi:hypothetical protein